MMGETVDIPVMTFNGSDWFFRMSTFGKNR